MVRFVFLDNPFLSTRHNGRIKDKIGPPSLNVIMKNYYHIFVEKDILRNVSFKICQVFMVSERPKPDVN